MSDNPFNSENAFKLRNRLAFAAQQHADGELTDEQLLAYARFNALSFTVGMGDDKEASALIAAAAAARKAAIDLGLSVPSAPGMLAPQVNEDAAWDMLAQRVINAYHQRLLTAPMPTRESLLKRADELEAEAAELMEASRAAGSYRDAGMDEYEAATQRRFAARELRRLAGESAGDG